MFKKLWEENNQVCGYSDEYLNGILTDYYGNPVNINDIHPHFIDCEESRAFADYLESNNISRTESIEVLPSIKFKIK